MFRSKMCKICRKLTTFGTPIDSLIIKRYFFDYCNMYATLFYYAFFKAPVSFFILTTVIVKILPVLINSY